VVDTLTNREIAVAVFYVAVVLMSATVWRRRGVLLVATACVGLTITSFVLTPGGDLDAGLANGVISVIAIATTTYLVLKMEEARAAIET
jgi:hypothetical protein